MSFPNFFFDTGILPPPYLIAEKAQDGNPVQQWDGSTLFYGTSSYGTPSGSSSEQVDVIGPGTPHPAGFELDKLMQLYWRAKRWKLTVQGDVYNYGTSSLMPIKTAEDNFYVFVREDSDPDTPNAYDRYTGDKLQIVSRQTGDIIYETPSSPDLSVDRNLVELRVSSGFIEGASSLPLGCPVSYSAGSGGFLSKTVNSIPYAPGLVSLSFVGYLWIRFGTLIYLSNGLYYPNIEINLLAQSMVNAGPGVLP